MPTPSDIIDPRYVSLLWTEADGAAEIAALHADLFDPPWDAESIRQLLVRPGAHALLAKLRLRPEAPPMTVGFVIGQLAADEAELITIGVMKPFHGRGIGGRLLDGLSRAMSNAGCRRLFLEVAADNEAAFALYRGKGFSEVGRRKAYYKRRDGTTADALVLSRALDTRPV